MSDAAVSDAGSGTARWYVFDSIAVARTSPEATAHALDLDGDGEVDNKLGGLFAALDVQSSYSLGSRTASAVTTGRLIELQSIDASDFDDSEVAAVGLARGADLDGDPDDNFSGSESFEVVPVAGAGGLLYGAIEGGELAAGPGRAAIQLAFDREVPVLAFSPLSTRVRCQVADSGLADGVIGFGIAEDRVVDTVLPALAAGLNATVDRQCQPSCPAGSEGEAFLSFFDDDGDGAISVEELTSNALLAATINNPDLDLLDGEGNPTPGGDGINDSLSFGFGFTAVGAGAPPE